MDAILVILTILSLAAAAVFAHTAWRTRHDAAQHSAARVAALASALGAEPGTGTGDSGSRIPISSMFAAATTDGRIVTKPAIAAIVGAVLLIAGGAVLRNGVPTVAGSPAGAAPLELVSMRHVREERTLTVTGLVRNPPDGAPLSGLAALVFAFDRGGEFIASGRGALDLPVLQPGEEAPFAVTVTDLPEVGRYRISFRTAAGPVRHVDRRAVRQLVHAR